MKKLLVFLVAFALIFSLAACGGDTTGDDKSKDSASKSESKSDPADTSSDISSVSADESSDVSDETSDETSQDPTKVIPAFINKYVSFGADVAVAVRATDPTSIRLTKINEVAEYGDIVLFTKEFGSTISTGSETYEDFAILVCTYDHKVFSYTRTSLKPVGEDATKSTTRIPADGFVIAVSKEQKTEITRLNGIKDENKFFVHGLQIGDVSLTLNKLTKAPVIDGKISASEYGAAKWKVDEKNILWDYSQFEKDNYYATAEVYSAYDKNYLYIAVIVDSPNHYCPLDQANASGMWNKECIQVNISSLDPKGDYISENYDFVTNPKAVTDGIVRQYGFAVNDKGETLHVVWIGIEKEFTGKAVCIRDSVNQKTYYEVAIPWSELGSEAYPFDVNNAERIGFSISINSTSEDDAGANIWKNIKMRDGGGIILRNDWSKIASAKLN